MKQILIFFLLIPFLSLTGCRRSSHHMWEDTKTASRYMSRGVRSIGGKQGDSRQVRNRSEFICQTDYDEPYSPLYDAPSPSQPLIHERESSMARRSSTEGNREIANISGQEKAHIFQTIHFPYNSSLIKGRENLVAIRRISEYLAAHPNVHIFIEGHCDERGPEAYNLALGSRRSNAIRNLLVKEGVNPDQLYTVSHGKERPINLSHTEDAWAENRRGEFKIQNPTG